MKIKWKLPENGFKIRDIVHISVGICIFIVIIIYLEIYRVDRNCQSLILDTESCIEGQKCATSLGRSSDYLTGQVRLFVVRQDPQNMWNYFEEVESKNRENMVEKLGFLYGDTDAGTVLCLKGALRRSHALEELEVHAMRLMAYVSGFPEEELPEAVALWELTEEEQQLGEEELFDRALDLVYGEEYVQAKKEITDHISGTLDLITDRLEKAQESSEDVLSRTFAEQRLFIFLMLLLICAVFWMVGALIMYPIGEHIRSIEDDKKWKKLGVYEIRYLAQVYNQLYDNNQDYKKELEYRADHDALTGIFNRSAFERKKDDLMGRMVNVGLILVDINEFKTVNDTKGHEVGDATIKKVARVFNQLPIKNKYCVARIGGDEFAMLLRDVKVDMFPAIEKEISRANEILGQEEGEIPAISISVGVAFSESGYTSSLFRKADQAMYEAKKSGEQKCKLYEKKPETVAS